MKKKLFLGLLAAAAVTFTACQKDEVISEVPQDQAIGFGTYVGRDAQTKANVIGETELKTQGFGVFAYYTANTTYPNDNTAYAPSFMNNEEVSFESSEWKYTNTKYWPGNSDAYKVSFFAYAPYIEIGNGPAPTKNITAFGTTGTGENTGKGDATLSFTVANTVSEQVDLLYATPVKDRWNGDISIQNPTYTEQTVKFTFNHALTRIGFKVKTDRPDYRVNISKITLTGDFNTVGTLNLNTGEWSGENNETDTDTYILNFNNANQINSTTATAITAIDGYVMTIPTNFTSSNLSVTVNYTYEYNVSSEVWAMPVSDDKTGTVSTNFEKGKAYTLVMTLDPMNPIQFSITSVTGWDENHTGYDSGVDVTNI